MEVIQREEPNTDFSVVKTKQHKGYTRVIDMIYALKVDRHSAVIVIIHLESFLVMTLTNDHFQAT